LNFKTQGIPHFWLQTFKRTDLILDMIQEYDEDVLLSLRDIKVLMNDKKPYGYTLEFHFAPNEYFTNKILTKSYELTCDKNDKDPFAYDGPVMYKCKGCIIDWNKGKNVTVKTIKKKQKHKSSGSIRVVLKEEKQDSFFNFFDTPTSDGFRPSYRSIIKPVCVCI
jgi:nucleosome assembly protein 1-like 1